MYIQWNGIQWHASQILCNYDGIKVGSMQATVCDVKCIESDSHSDSHTSFMLDTINATIFKLILPYMATGQVVDS